MEDYPVFQVRVDSTLDGHEDSRTGKAVNRGSVKPLCNRRSEETGSLPSTKNAEGRPSGVTGTEDHSGRSVVQRVLRSLVKVKRCFLYWAKDPRKEETRRHRLSRRKQHFIKARERRESAC